MGKRMDVEAANSHVLVRSKFPILCRKSTRISWMHFHKLDTSLSPEASLN